MQCTEQGIAQVVFDIINSRVAHVHIAPHSSSGMYSFNTGTFVGNPKEVSVSRGFNYLVMEEDFPVFVRWIISCIPVSAQHVVWVGPPVVSRVAQDKCYVIAARLELFDPFGSPVFTDRLLWDDKDKVKRFEISNGVM